ncbi:amidohydrolase family protein [Herbiconiux sp. KACC 21604]|uniref:amidohydrolase family protein n=1 Tax=unclassified Herbiconiux TaxID=2618217 RepID=UPI0014917E86|nr:amidohydrolase family protein [Herbiconiux sp. SALV-R1]QJU54766.1 amidohydrolase family protein [Herbiconiux sp. SALV-R1]WPO85875.1 amidohydrolase family protein [Herbiconiux sp. KACC 21604]
MTSSTPVTPDLPLRRWAPVSQLRAARTEVPRPAVPCIDVHNHLGRWLSEGEWMIDDVGSLLAVMDACDVELVVNLDGRWGEELDENLARYDLAHPGRFATFCQLDWELLRRPDGGAALLRQLDDSVRRGARGVKVWKNLGLEVVDAEGRLVAPDDPRVVAVLRRAGEHGIPVLIHTADPIAFFEPLDERNERLDELGAMPEWWFGDRSRHPDFDTLLAAHARLVMACPGTSFIGAHVGCAAEDLDRVDALLRSAPNYHVDIAGRLAELGRQPRRFARLVAEHPDRVLFGTDIYPATAEQYALHYRFLESADEGFSYAPEEAVPPQGRWAVSAADLDPALLRGVYRDNARRLLGL